jgi:hypothetical protein
MPPFFALILTIFSFSSYRPNQNVLDILVMLINKYENYQIDEVDPIQVIKSKPA